MSVDKSAQNVELTDRQREALDCIRQSYLERGFGPTIREIGHAMGIVSPNGVMVHLRALKRKGHIERSANLSRSIQLTDDPRNQSNGIPLVGDIAAGLPAEANEQDERLDLQGMFGNTPGNWALRVKGQSMVDAHIDDGDFVVVRSTSTARKGDIAVVRTEDGDATLKYWFPEKNRIRLQPANNSMKPIYVRQAAVLGVVVGVVRKFK